MLKFRFKEAGIKTHLFSIVVSLLFAFLCFELLLPINSKPFLFKSAYGIEYALSDSIAPSSIVFSNNEYEVKSNKTIFISYDLEGKDNCCKQVLCWSDDDNVALVYSTNFNEIIVTGVSCGSTNIYVASAIDNSVKKSIVINVSEFEPLSYEGLEVSPPCYILESNLIYQTTTTIEYGQNLKFNYVVKNDKFVIIPATLTYEIDDVFSKCIDDNGNFISRSECIGKTISVKVWSPFLLENYNLQPIQYSVRVNYPADYGNVYLSTYWNIFLTYCFSFAIFGLMIGVIFNYIDSKNKNRLLIFLSVFTVLLSFGILILHTIILFRTFWWIYWIVSPLISLICFLMSYKSIRGKLLSIIKGVFEWKKDILLE